MDALKGFFGYKSSDKTEDVTIETRRLLEELEQQYKEVIGKQRRLEEKSKRNEIEREDLLWKLEENEKERHQLDEEYAHIVREVDKKREDLQLAQRELSGAARMQAIGHQVVGCKDSSHEEVKLMYERFFGGQAANVKKVLKKEFGPIKTKFMLSRIFQIIYDNVKRMLMELILKSELVDEAQQPNKPLNIRDRLRDAKENDDRLQILKAVQVTSWKGMKREEKVERIQQAIAPLFEVPSSGDSCSRFDMSQMKMVYGIFLQSCGLTEMAKESSDKMIKDMKDEILASKFSKNEGFKHLESLAGKLLDTYITGGVRLAWTMVTRIPPMIAKQPTTFDPHCTLLEDCNEGDVAKQPTISMRPILFFSYEGQVAVQGIVTSDFRQHPVDNSKHQATHSLSEQSGSHEGSIPGTKSISSNPLNDGTDADVGSLPLQYRGYENSGPPQLASLGGKDRGADPKEQRSSHETMAYSGQKHQCKSQDQDKNTIPPPLASSGARDRDAEQRSSREKMGEQRPFSDSESAQRKETQLCPTCGQKCQRKSQDQDKNTIPPLLASSGARDRDAAASGQKHQYKPQEHGNGSKHKTKKRSEPTPNKQRTRGVKKHCK